MLTPQLTFVLLILGVVASFLGCEQKENGLKEALRNQLMRRFPDKEILGEGEFAFTQEQNIEELPIDSSVAALLPNYKFFKTQLTTSYLEYTFVDVIVAINARDHADIKVLLSPTFTPESQEFFELFYGLGAKDVDERRKLSQTIARMLESITFQGSLENVEMGANRHVFNLYRQNVSQNLLTFEFDDTGSLTAIKVTKGSGVR